jgi:hypothetical protein
MNAVDRWERWAPVSGLVFVVSFLGLFFMFFVPTEVGTQGASATQIADYYQGRGQAALLLMYTLIGLAGISLLWFSGSVSASLRRAEPAPGRLAGAALAGGVASATLLLAGGATLLAPFTVVALSSRAALDPTLHEALSAMGFLAVNFGLLGGTVMVVATSLVAVRFGGFPAWFAWLGFLVAVALALNILYFFGLFIWAAWVLLASLLLLARPIGRTALAGPPAVDAPSTPPAPRPAS